MQTKFLLLLASTRGVAVSLFTLLALSTGSRVAQAGSYGPQAFTFPNGTVAGSDVWNDGLTLTSTGIGTPPVPVASVSTNALRLSVEGVTNTLATLKVSDLDPGQDISAFTLSFGLRMAATGLPGNGFSVSFGDIPPEDADGELGYALPKGLVVGFRTFVDVANGQTQGEIAIYADRVKLGTFPQTFFYDATSRNISIHWDSQGVDITYASATVANNFAVPGFTAMIGDRFAIAARTGETVSQTVLIDNLQVKTTPTASVNTGGFIISEFVADNKNSLEDDDLETPDWIEIYNGGGTLLSLAGWFLTTDPTNKTQWPLPSATVPGNQFRIVFASGKNRSPTNGTWHANFTLPKSGGYLALIRPDLTVASEYTYGPQKLDIAYGEVGSTRVRGYLETPTPLKKNVSLVADGVPAEDIIYSRQGGVLTNSEPVTLSISAPKAANAVVRYTLNNAIPDESSAVYSGPFSITNSRTIRARVFMPGRLPGRASSRTFLKLDTSLLRFANTGAPFSSSLPVLIFDSFGVDIDSASSPGGRPFRPNYAVVFRTDPANGHSHLTDVPDFVGRSGLHVRGESSSGFPQRSYAWEVWDETGNDEDASILGLPADSDWTLHGPWSDKTLMRNYLAYSTMDDSRSDFAAPRSLFVEVFYNQEAGQPVSYNDYRGVFLLVEKLKRAKGRLNIAKINPLVTDTNLITGGYMFKRDKDSPGASSWTTSAFGVGIQSHDPEAFSLAQVKYLQGYLNDFEKALNGPGFGDPVTGYEKWIDVPSFIDAQWWTELTKQVDGYVFSTYFYKDRGSKVRAGPLWDFNISLGNADYATGDRSVGWLYDETGVASLGGGLWYPRLQADPDYRIRNWDRYWELRRGVWSDAAITGRIDAAVGLLLDGTSTIVSNNLPLSVQSPAARQYGKYPILATRQWPNPGDALKRFTFQEEIDSMKQWILQRLAWVDDQNLGGISILRPPIFSRPGGVAPLGAALSIAPFGGTPPPGKNYPLGTVYYTLDGSDPRPSAYPIPTTQELVLVPEFQTAAYFVPTTANGGSSALFPDWNNVSLGATAAGLDWKTGRLGLGFDDNASPLYANIGGGTYGDGDIRAAMQGISSTVFIRVPFTVSAAQIESMASMKLKMRADDGFVAYLNGIEIARYNLRATNTPAFDTLPNAVPSVWKDTVSVVQKEYAVTNFLAKVRAGDNVLAILGLNQTVADDDALFSPKLVSTVLVPPGTPITTQVYGGPIAINSTMTVKARVFSSGYWSPVATATYVVGAVPAAAGNLVISEIMYNPAPPAGAELAVATSASDFEYLEFLNISANTLDLANVRMTNGVLFNFSSADPIAQSLPPGKRLVVCANRAAFQARYGTLAEGEIAGAFTDSLNNGGEVLTLVDNNGGVITSFAYGDSEPWPIDADGSGYSIVLNSPYAQPPTNPALGSNWRSSAAKNGSPARGDSLPFTLDPNGDSDGDGLPNLLEYAIGSDPLVASSVAVLSAGIQEFTVSGSAAPYVTFSYRRNLLADSIVFEVKTSAQLSDWTTSAQDLIYVGTHNNGNGTATVTLRTATPVNQATSHALFARLVVHQ